MASKAVTFEDLVRFHREVIVPDLDARFERIEEKMASDRLDMLTHFDALYTRLDAMATEHTTLDSAVRRLEVRVTKLETRS